MLAKFIVQGRKKLKGDVFISGSKNATLPIISACLLTDQLCVLKNVPNIADVRLFINLIEQLGAKTKFDQQANTLTISAKNLEKKPLLDKSVKKMRASILLIGSLLARLKEVSIYFPGGCVIGKRTIYPHLFAFEKLGAKIEETPDILKLKTSGLKGNFIVLPEISVTATENAVLAAVTAPGTTKIHLAACEPHVQDLCLFLNKMGAKISGIGTHFIEIQGVKELHGAEHSIVPDYIETGTFAIASVITGSEITLKNIVPKHLDSFWQKLREAGADFELNDSEASFYPISKINHIEKLQTAVYPGFATDLQAPFSVLLTQGEGKSMIFETLFEGRLNYLFELEKMEAKVQIINPYQAIVEGPKKLKGCSIASCDLRAGAAMVLASLIASGTTEISNIDYIDRGYEGLDEKLRKVGAEIRRV